MIIAAHDLELVLELCERAVLMDGGQVIADGPARGILATPDLMYPHGLEVSPSFRNGARPA